MEIDLFKNKQKKKQLEELEKSCQRFTGFRDELTLQAVNLYNRRKGFLSIISSIERNLEQCKGLPNWCKNDIDDAKSMVRDFEKAVEYETDPKAFAEISDTTGRTAAIIATTGGVVGAGVGVGGATAAMSIATVMGTASTGTAISALSGVAATNAALAWLGGGALAAGGAGVAGGNLVLGLFGPIGAAIAVVGAAGGFVFMRAKNKKQIELAEQQLNEINHDNDILSQKLKHLNDLIFRTSTFEENNLGKSFLWVCEISKEKPDYASWNDDDRHQLERLLNNVSNAVSLINERI